MIIGFPIFWFLFHLFQRIDLSVIVLAITAYVIYQQVVEARKSSKFLEYQTRPIAWFFLMSPKTLDKCKGWVTSTHWLFVKNESKFKVFLYYKIDRKLEDNQKNPVFNGQWDNNESPLHIYPGLMQYPSVLSLSSELIQHAKNKKVKIRFDIFYGLAPDYAPREIRPKVTETWRFDVIKETWEGPNGIPDAGFASMITSMVNEKMDQSE